MISVPAAQTVVTYRENSGSILWHERMTQIHLRPPHPHTLNAEPKSPADLVDKRHPPCRRIIPYARSHHRHQQCTGLRKDGRRPSHPCVARAPGVDMRTWNAGRTRWKRDEGRKLALWISIVDFMIGNWGWYADSKELPEAHGNAIQLAASSQSLRARPQKYQTCRKSQIRL